MSVDQVKTTAQAPPCPNGDPSTWVYLADLTLPPEEQAWVEERTRATTWWWWYRDWHRREIGDWVKLQHFFPGKTVAIKSTPRGRVVLMVGEYGSPEFSQFMKSLSPAERSEVTLDWIKDPNDDSVTYTL